MCVMIFFSVVLCSVLVNKVTFSMHVHQHSNNNNNLHNPCPEFFNYQMDKSGTLFGHLILDSKPQNNVIQVHLELSVGNEVGNDRGNLALFYDNEKVKEDIKNNRPIEYKIIFPPWQNYPPKLTKIVVNGNLICQGPGYDKSSVPILTTIQLLHTLTIENYWTLMNNNNNNNNNFIPPNNRFDPVVPTPTIKPNIVLPETTPQFVDRNPVIINNPPRQKPVSTTTELIQPQNTNIQDVSSVCGRPLVTNQLVFGGHAAPKGAYPWLTALYLQEAATRSVKYICGGTLISHKHVVTAAHCVVEKRNQKLITRKPKDLLVSLGKFDLKFWSLSAGEKVVNPASVHRHPDYASNTADADIALLILEEIIQFNPQIIPICLWSGPESVVGHDGTMAGWGKTENDSEPEEPIEISIPIVDDATCLRSHMFFSSISSNRTLCAGRRDKTGPCNGDSGSGLIFKRNNVWMLRGIVSLSLPDENKSCDLTNFVLFVDVFKFQSWIYSFMKS